MGIPRRDPPRQRVPMNFRWPVIDPEWSDIAINALDDRVARDADRSQNLQAAIDHPAKGLGTEYFGHASFVARLLVTVQQPRRMPNRQTRQMQIDLIVGQHETDALVLADRATKGVAPSGVFGCDCMAAARRAEPAHAMSQTRRPEPDLGIAESLPDLAQHAVRRDVYIFERNLGVSTRRIAVDRF